MKKMTLSLLTIVSLNTVLMAGADVAPVVEPVSIIPEVSSGAFYVGLGISAVSNREGSLDFFEVTNGQDRTGDISLLAGYEFNPYIALEGRYMTSITEEDILDRSSWGIYAKPQYPVTDDVKVYALLGYGGFEAEGISGANIDVDETGFQWGFGASYDMTEHISLFADYLNIANDVRATSYISAPADVSSDAITLGVIYKF